ncbi:c-type cytochrome [Phenylobacterium sp.]|jgi:cytochrome c|uniref:c-type cytochrome n=1 Tax=Phenylobacterium sp. TaxID=1871053 RepID=UPI002F3EFBC9
MNRRFLPAGAILAVTTVLSGGFWALSAQAQTPSQPPAQTPGQNQPTATPPAATPPPLFAVCQACHESTAGAGPSVGPNLFGVGGRKVGTAKDFDYSDAMKNSPIVWSADTLTAFITDPAKTIPNNKMDYSGADAATAKQIADYLMTLKP